MIIYYLLLFVAAVTGIYACANAAQLLSHLDLIDEAFQKDVTPDIHIMKNVERILAQLFYLVATIIILVTILNAQNPCFTCK